MVKHGRSKKRRAGRIGKVKLKNRSWNRWNPNPKIEDPIIRQNWDPSKSPSVNMLAMGLKFDPNGSKRTTAGPVNAKPSKTYVVELFDVPEFDKPSRRTMFPLTEEEEIYISKAMSKHGDNYDKMFFDLKVNPMQHTREKLKRMGARYLLLAPRQRRVDVPESILPLLPTEYRST